MKKGKVLTSTRSLDILEDRVYKDQLLKVVTGWGIHNQKWSSLTRARICGMTDETVVRSEAGSGSTFPHVEALIAEFSTWYAFRKTRMWFEVGNEPIDIDIDGYAWHLKNALPQLRRTFPKARFISPALRPDQVIEWSRNENFIDAIKQFDAIGVHQYAYVSLARDDTQHRRWNNTAYYGLNSMPWALTEFGINDPRMVPSLKLAYYDAYIPMLEPKYAMALTYHICSDPINEDQRAYAI